MYFLPILHLHVRLRVLAAFRLAPDAGIVYRPRKLFCVEVEETSYAVVVTTRDTIGTVQHIVSASAPRMPSKQMGKVLYLGAVAHGSASVKPRAQLSKFVLKPL